MLVEQALLLVGEEHVRLLACLLERVDLPEGDLEQRQVVVRVALGDAGLSWSLRSRRQVPCARKISGLQMSLMSDDRGKVRPG